MSHSYRDDAPAQFSLFRRKILIGGGLMIGGLPAAPHIPAAGTDAAATGLQNQFMQLSSLLIAHRLDPDIGLRLATALSMKDPAFTAHVSSLIAVAQQRNAKVVEDFFADVPDGPLKDTALRIISGWYLGVIVDATDAEVFAYDLAR